MSFKQQVQLRRIKDLLCSAFEGGSNYWIKIVDTPAKSKRHKQVEYWHECGVHDWLVVHTEGDEGKKDNCGKGYRLDFDACNRGMAVFAAKFPEHFGDFMAENDDATTADVYLQCCLFGDTIYG